MATGVLPLNYSLSLEAGSIEPSFPITLNRFTGGTLSCGACARPTSSHNLRKTIPSFLSLAEQPADEDGDKVGHRPGPPAYSRSARSVYSPIEIPFSAALIFVCCRTAGDTLIALVLGPVGVSVIRTLVANTNPSVSRNGGRVNTLMKIKIAPRFLGRRAGEGTARGKLICRHGPRRGFQNDLSPGVDPVIFYGVRPGRYGHRDRARRRA